ncbi:hypothetical protein Drorol1_Dr00026293 [Drosera rotundifolia]
MDFYMKQWHESDQQQPKTTTATLSSYSHSPSNTQRVLFQDQYHHHLQQQQFLQHKQQEQEACSESALPLFVVPEPVLSTKPITVSSYPDSHSLTPRLPKMGGYFSLAQMQELELQALIYRHMVAGSAVPHELLLLVKKSLLNSSHYFLQHSSYPYYHPNWYWGRAAMDPEPGRCRRTDGKKWRCSRDAVEGQKYCERHIHRGRNRSRKPVEFPTSSTTFSSAPGGGHDAAGANAGSNGSSLGTGAPYAVASGTSSGAHFSLSGAAAAMDMFQLNQRLPSESKPQHEPSGDDSSNNRVLRCFFDAWPQSSDHTNSGSSNSSASLSMVPTPKNPSSDFLKLSTGSNGQDPETHRPMNWWGGSSNTVGGPLAEALRSPTGSSPANALHQLQRASACDSSFVIA